jgi:hypothetical protein
MRGTVEAMNTARARWYAFLKDLSLEDTGDSARPS